MTTRQKTALSATEEYSLALVAVLNTTEPDGSRPWALERVTVSEETAQAHARLSHKDGPGLLCIFSAREVYVLAHWPRDGRGVPVAPLRMETQEYSCPLPAATPRLLARELRDNFLPRYMQEYAEMTLHTAAQKERQKDAEETAKRIANVTRGNVTPSGTLVDFAGPLAPDCIAQTHENGTVSVALHGLGPACALSLCEMISRFVGREK